jgi:hypothetical protein
VTVGNIITSMRQLSALNWQRFVESVSLTEPILAGDPAGVYAQMDFATRDRYRHVIERIARRTHTHELEVARRTIELANQADERDPQAQARSHVGYYLIDDGRAQLEREFQYRPSLIRGPGTTRAPGLLLFESICGLRIRASTRSINLR